MLRKHAQFFKTLFIISDLLILSLTWVLSYYLRFYFLPIRPRSPGIPPLTTYLEFLLPLCVIWLLTSNRFGLYRPRRTEHSLNEVFDIAKSLTFSFVILIVVIYLLRRFEFSRLAFLYFLEVGFLGLLSMRYFTRKTL